MAEPRTPADLQTWAQTRARRRPETWLGQDDLGDGDVHRFPLAPPTTPQVRTHPDAAARWLSAWQAWPAPPGAKVVRVERRWHPFGAVRVPTHVEVTGSSALAGIAGPSCTWSATRSVAERLSAHWHLATYLADALVAQRSTLATLTEPELSKLIDVVDWLVAHPTSGLQLRHVPVEGVDTKWLERHTGLVRSFVAAVGGVDEWGLVGEAQRFRVRVLDPALEADVRDFTAPVSELAAGPWRPATVLVVENQASLVGLGSLPGTIAVHGRGLAAELLGQVGWLRNARVLYWGDLDSWGFLCLSRCRRSLPHAESVLMDAATLRAFERYAVPEPTTYWAEIEHLTPAEAQTLQLLRDGRLRLEQERVGLEFAQRGLADAVRSANPQLRG